MRTYAQYCPIARASEILARRWTPIIVRDLLGGPTSYSRLADGAPGLSRSLLTSRLRELQELGLVETVPAPAGGGSLYGLTAAGRDLGGVIEAMGAWGERWLDVTPQQADPAFVLNAWSSRYLAVGALPDDRVVVRFDFTDQPLRVNRFWMVFQSNSAEVCRAHPGFDEDLIVQTESVALAEWHLGRTEWAQAIRAGRIHVTGPRNLARSLPTWNVRSQWVTADHLATRIPSQGSSEVP
ncbi:MAG: helix-turn-helix domain-containing protein [Actinomycetota bacterium]